jgi:hypothetical protein
MGTKMVQEYADYVRKLPIIVLSAMATSKFALSVHQDFSCLKTKVLRFAYLAIPMNITKLVLSASFVQTSFLEVKPVLIPIKNAFLAKLDYKSTVAAMVSSLSLPKMTPFTILALNAKVREKL